MNINELIAKHNLTDEEWPLLTKDVSNLTESIARLIFINDTRGILETENEEDALTILEQKALIHEVNYLSRKFMIKYATVMDDLFHLE